ncbi:hypothetical protein B5K11_08685 [Rhizobium leguminosarum bv. trifolii]|uniref:hypothetical protein n=1 Tax=Rhizobium leguminosarum TaxID=384 RepID=UPI000E2E8848|nr:hypothetical protein [Rhizobium leguminosarum]RFB95044.1 hypothetical protein B5K11_08685 [Rhizobium leguminosarum bv. trifolii]
MKSKTLAFLMTARSMGVSPLGISASAQDAPILPEKGTAQSGQFSKGAAQHRQASAAGRVWVPQAQQQGAGQ